MEIPEKLQGPDLRPYSTLPLVKIRLVDIDKLTCMLPPLANIAFFTVESMYNGVFMPAPTCQYYATFPIPLTPVEPNEERELQLLHFENGLVEEYVDINFRKKWYSISFSPGRTCLMKYRINYKFDDVKDQDDVGVDFTKLPLVKEPRVNWNSLRRMWFTPKHEQFFKETIIKYRLWPIEITVSPSGPIELSERLKMGGKKKPEETPETSPTQTPQTAKPKDKGVAKGKEKEGEPRKSAAGRKSEVKSRKSVARKSVARKSVARKSVAKGSRKSVASRKSAVGKRQSKIATARKSTAAGSRAGSSSRTVKVPSRSAKEKEERKPANPDIKHFVAYIDLSCLLFPGGKKPDQPLVLLFHYENIRNATPKLMVLS
ncbi:hypothetical protein GE061_017175 [Apolygus lucorum]|uniref:Uncharacterized protein n=1 Tax=Apolygus lucorum TaxID=248454 RepID=A0A8S9XIB1_APOLU|nr:hypothetical protein GE061_017175 [Apolygus lucorum]